MALTVDAMAERYGKLPTEVLKDASTVDLIVFDVALSYRNHQQKKANGGNTTDAYSQEELEVLVEKLDAGLAHSGAEDYSTLVFDLVLKESSKW